MIIKNQKTLFISAAVIIGLTVFGLVGLNIVVEKISHITPPPFAMAIPTRPPDGATGLDDKARRPRLGEEAAPPEGMPPEEGQFRGMPPGTDSPDAMRRVRNGKDALDLKRAVPKPPPTKDDASGQRPPPSSPGSSSGQQPGYYPPPYPGKMDQQERDMMQRQMEQYYGPPGGGGPPPGYYPPEGYPPPPGTPGYDPSEQYWDFEEDYEDYEYNDVESRREEPEENKPRLTKTNQEEADHELDGSPEEDEYIDDGQNE